MREAMSRRSAAIIILVFAVLLFVGIVSLSSDDASASIFRVPDSYPTIQSAVDAAGPGDEVYVGKGPYNERIRINKALTLRGTSSIPVIIKASGSGTIITLLASDIIISNFELQGGPGITGIKGQNIIDCYLRDLTIKGCDVGISIEKGNVLLIAGCTVSASETAGLYVRGSVDSRFEDITISNSFFINNNGMGIHLERCRHVKIDGIGVSNNGRNGIVAFKVAHAHVRNSTMKNNIIGLKLEDSHGWRVEDNVISKNKREGIELNQSGDEIANQIRRNTIAENSGKPGTTYAAISFAGRGASDNVVERNLIQYNPVGVSFNSSSGGCRWNSFYLNEFRNCAYAIDEMRGTGPNTFLLNVFKANQRQALGLNDQTEFHRNSLGNHWADYSLRYEDAVMEGMVWSEPYQVNPSGSVYDDYPLIWPYEDERPQVDLGMDRTATIGMTELISVYAKDDSGIDLFEWTIIPPSGYAVELDQNSPFISYTFMKLGEYWVRVQVTDVWGHSSTDATKVDVIDDVAPRAKAGPDISVPLGEAVTLDATNSSDNHGIASLHWVFDPSGEDMKIREPIHTLVIDQLGTFIAVLFVVDYSGNSATDTLVITIYDLSPPVAVAGSDVTINLGGTVTFDASASHDNVGIVEYKWTLTKGSMMRVFREVVVTYEFLELGKYTMDLRVTDTADQFDVDQVIVLVIDTEPPVANAGNDAEALMGTEVRFSSAGSTDNVEIEAFQWSFFYRIKTYNLHGRTAKWQFDVPGEYQVTLTVWDEAGNFDTDVMLVTIRDSMRPEAIFNTPEQVEIGTSLVLDGSLSDDNVDVVSYEWRVTHKTVTHTLKGAMVSYPVDDPGAYQVVLVVKDAAGNEDMHSTSFTVPPKETVSETPGWLVPTMVVVVASVLLVSYLLARRRFGGKE
jgi:parallel beta-helix repeat protein